MTIKTRRPTGKPSWPITLIAGAEKAGKSWACAEASASDLIGRTLWVGAGEDDPDEYGNIPGADFEIVEHDGTYRGILAAVTDAAAEPAGDKPTLLIVDSMTRIWDLLCDEAQQVANRRARAKAERYNKPVPTEDVQITMDLWNVAKDRWDAIVDALRAHQGPVLVTARLEEVTLLDDNGKPTAEKMLKVKGHKSLPYDVGAIVELPQRGEAWLRGVRSTRLQLAERTKLKSFTVDTLWRNLGLAETETGKRQHAAAAAEKDIPAASPTLAAEQAPTGNPDPARDWVTEADLAETGDELKAIYDDAKAAGANLRSGSPLWKHFGQRMTELREAAA